jgi:sialate O-acetylesterase
VGNFSAVGYFFGRQLHETLGVPIGLIDNAWGGSSAEAWVPRDVLAADERYDPLMRRWKENEAKEDLAGPMAAFEVTLAEWDKAVSSAKRAGQEPPSSPTVIRTNVLATQHRPGNLHNGCLHPILGFGIQGVIWYQGESNAGRAYQYRHLFPLMIQEWRKAWGQGDFPFYWVQLADFQNEEDEPKESSWAELREAQSMTLSALPNTGEAVIIDIGEGRDIHPRNKQEVGLRLARWAMARDYGVEVPYQSPTYKSMETRDGKVLLTFDHVGQGLYSFDVREPLGFAVAGEDRRFVWARARIVGTNQVEVASAEVPNPVAVRYAWAQNPVCTLQSREGLPANPFRTDDWPGVTAGKD